MRKSREVAVAAAVERARVATVAGIAVGLLVVGLGSRGAMLLLRLTSPREVRGRVSDDGFVIGRVTLAGSYQLLQLGAVVGVLGAVVYLLVAPWLLGPWWLRRFTTGAACAAVAGSMLLHSDGIDFRLLRPTWLAVGLFVALPGLFGVVIGVAVDRVAAGGSWTGRGRARWAVPVALLAAGPAALLLLVPYTAVTVTLAALVGVLPRPRHVAYGLLVRMAWLAVAVAGLVALVSDIRAITA